MHTYIKQLGPLYLLATPVVSEHTEHTFWKNQTCSEVHHRSSGRLVSGDDVNAKLGKFTSDDPLEQEEVTMTINRIGLLIWKDATVEEGDQSWLKKIAIKVLQDSADELANENEDPEE